MSDPKPTTPLRPASREVRPKREAPALVPARAIAEVLTYADPSGTSNYGPLKVVEGWLSGFDPERKSEAPDPPPVLADAFERLLPLRSSASVDAQAEAYWTADPPPARAIAELAEHAARVVDPEMAAALEEVEQWLSGFDPDDEGTGDEANPSADPLVDEIVGSVEQEVLETLCGGGTGGVADDVIDAISIVARAVDELAKRTESEWAALRSVIDEAAAESRQQIQRSVSLALGGGAR